MYFRGDGGPAVSEEDVVCVQDEKKARLSWDLARVVRLLIGRDGQMWSAVVQVNTSAGKERELRRPIQRLFPVKLGSGKQRTDPQVSLKFP